MDFLGVASEEDTNDDGSRLRFTGGAGSTGLPLAAAGLSVLGAWGLGPGAWGLRARGDG